MLAFHGNPVLKHQLIAYLPLDDIEINAGWQETHGLPAWAGHLLKNMRRTPADNHDEVQRSFLLAISISMPVADIPMPEVLNHKPASALGPAQSAEMLTTLTSQLLLKGLS